MMPRSAIQKGKELENFVVEKIRTSGLDIHAKRQEGSGNGLKKGDIYTALDWTIECKNTKNFNYKEAAAQVQRESMGYQHEAIIWHPPQRPLGDSIVIINIDEFIDLLKQKQKGMSRDEIFNKREFKYNLEKLCFHAKQVIKEMPE